ncbi:hypothetical protein M422DRAFT_47144 [Sphaerobolus stellatus SS14]|uniref:CCHC-type domain-containing protein n=1 Tax=Sphaerobolus stellatus (strain SS14) TaxID=990650 RepID=A0A0C9VCL9_SPHS4|nr:hypothetical protein M422DRAFT_47144 [Sphaerobolus stellatus SS14]
MGLLSSYKAVIINFNATPTEQLTLEHVISHLLNEEVRQASSDDKTKQEEEEVNGTLTAVGLCACHSQMVAKAAAHDITCFFCGKKGHYKSKCSEKINYEKFKQEEEKKKKGYAGAAISLDSSTESKGSTL